MRKLFQNTILLLLLALAACKDEYLPKLRPGAQSVLIVEGVLNTGNGPTEIKLSRSIRLTDSTAIQKETGAQVIVEREDGDLTMLPAMPDTGTYRSDQLFLNAGDRYRLLITTVDGQQYASDFISPHTNPPIDSVNWKRDSAGATIFVNTHNPENNSRYYRWEYDETWEIRSRYYADPIPDDGMFDPIYPGENIYNCWKYYNSAAIILASTEQLSSDLISQKPLIKILDGDDRLSERYRLVVRQYSLDKQGYEFYKQLQKNTESIGSIFDAQPSEIGGNIHCLTDTSMRVIGYLTATSIDSTVLWINGSEVPHWKELDCSESKVVDGRTEDINNYKGDWLVYAFVEPNKTYYLGRRECVSCRLRGGSTHRPPYW